MPNQNHNLLYKDYFTDELTNYPVRFAQPVFFGEAPYLSESASISNGTMSMVKFNNKFMGVTCQHVLEGYRSKVGDCKTLVFQMGMLEINPLTYLIDESETYDLALFDLTDFVGKVDNLNESNFAEFPDSSKDVSIDDIICFAGFPGVWRKQLSLGKLQFYSFSHGACGVNSVGEGYFYTRVEIEECLTKINNGIVLGSLAGMSGGPVFAWRRNGILRAELVGFIKEYGENFDLMYIQSANVLSQDGTFLK
jgi:hypothetical protein